MSNLSEFLSITKSKVGCGYVFGAQGQIMTQALWDSTYKYNYDADEREKYYALAKQWFGKQCFDCSGLIIWTLQQLKLLTVSQDYIAHNIYHKLCTAITEADLVAGDLCFHKQDSGNISHVGIYIGNDQVLHARGTAYGVVVTGMLDTFNLFGRLTLIQPVWVGWEEIINMVSDSASSWIAAINAVVNAANATGDMGAMECFKYLKTFIEKVYNNRSGSDQNDWTVIVKEMTSSPVMWEIGINAALQTANAGVFAQLKFLPQLITKIYNS